MASVDSRILHLNIITFALLFRMVAYFAGTQTHGR